MIALISIVVLPVAIGWLHSRKQNVDPRWALPGFGVYKPGIQPRSRPAPSEH